MFQETITEAFWKSEAFCKQLLEKALGCKLEKKRPTWLKCEGRNLEFDGYDQDLKVAFEYNGRHHFNNPAWPHTTREEFEIQQRNDQAKVQLCEERGINLIVIPWSVDNDVRTKRPKRDWEKCLVEYISSVTGVLLTGQKYQPVQKGINITDVLTAASLAKRIFWLKYYDQKNYPIYTLKDSIDSYIRDFYYGGRVEVFHLGKVPSERLYYFDFTSLYPYVGLQDLPYGEPEWVDEFDVNRDFGFVSVKVRSKPEFFKQKPLHARKADGKLTFQHYREYQNFVLFSEELRMELTRECMNTKFKEVMFSRKGVKS